MPVRQLTRMARTPRTAELKERLVTEWRSSQSTAAQPVILEEKVASQIRHFYVVWDEWQPLSQMERSEIIMDAAAEVLGPKETANITVAMGLLPVEADRLGIKYS